MSSQGSILTSFSSGEMFIPNSDREDCRVPVPSGTNIAESPQPKKSRGNLNMFNEKLVGTFDRCKVTDREAVYLVIAICQGLKILMF